MKKTERLLLLPFLLASLLCALILLGGRFSAEWRDRDVLAVLSDADLATLVDASGVSAHVWREMLAPADGYLTAPDEASGLPLALIENEDRTGILPLEAFDPETYGGPMVKALYLYAPDYSWRASQNDARAVEDLLFRAVTDRGLRLLILTPLCDAEGNPVTDPAIYRNMLEGLQTRLEARGYTFGKTFSCMNFHTPACGLLAGAAAVARAERIPALALSRCRGPLLRRRGLAERDLLPAAPFGRRRGFFLLRRMVRGGMGEKYR